MRKALFALFVSLLSLSLFAQSGNYKRFENNVAGESLDYRPDNKYDGSKKPLVARYLVLRNIEKNKKGVWKNAWTFKSYNGEKTHYPGEWRIGPKWDWIKLRYSGLDPNRMYDDCVAIVGVKSGKAEDAPLKYGLVEANGGWGYGHELLPAKYDFVYATDPEKGSGPLLVSFGNRSKDGKGTLGVWKVGYKRKPNQFDKMEAFLVLPEQYQYVNLFHPNHIAAKKDGKFGLYDSDGNLLLPHAYSDISVCSYGLVGAQKEEGGLYGVLDLQGNTVLPFEYEKIVFCPGGTVIYGNDGLYGALLPSGEKVPVEFTSIRESFWTRKSGEKVISLILEKDGTSHYLSHGRLIPIMAPMDTRADSTRTEMTEKGNNFSAWLEGKLAKLKENFLQRGEFEKEADYAARIADPANLKDYLSTKLPDPVKEYLKSFPVGNTLYFDKYDTENECFPLYSQQSPWDVIRVPVPIEAAQEFKEKSFLGKSPREMEIRNDFPAIKNVSVFMGNEEYFVVRAQW